MTSHIPRLFRLNRFSAVPRFAIVHPGRHGYPINSDKNNKTKTAMNIKRIVMCALAVFALAWNGCGGGDDGGEPEPGPGEETPDVPETPGEEEVAPTVTWALASDIAGLDDAGVKAALSHVRVYLFDGEEKLLSVEKCESADKLTAQELEAGTYTAVLVGNVPNDENISTETVGTALSNPSN